MLQQKLLAARAGAVLGPLFVAACFHGAEPPADPGPPLPVVEYVAEQEILTPLPLRVRLPASYGAERVLVVFHMWGSRTWGALELAREGQTWSGEVSCREVSTVTGDTRYYFLAVDEEGRVVASSGSPEWPHVATIVRELPGGTRSLAGEGPLRRCHDVADCPPDFPGCPAYPLLRPRCLSDDDCGEDGQCAWDGYCDGAPEASASAQADLEGDQLLKEAIRRAKRQYDVAAREPRPSR